MDGRSRNPNPRSKELESNGPTDPQLNADSFSLRPEAAVDLVLSPGIIKRTYVLDISDQRIALAHPSPPLDARHLMLPAILTYLPTSRPRMRYGFDVMIMSLSDDYEMAGKKCRAAIVLKTSSIRRMDLRFFPRVKIEGLRIFLGDDELDILNVSAGGAHLFRRGRLQEPVKAGTTIMLSLTREGHTLNREARIMRLWRIRGLHGSEHLAVKFIQPVDF